MIFRNSDRRRRRRGAVLVDAALVMLTFLTLVLGMIDLGIAVFRQQVVSRAAREGARRVIVNGKAAMTTWGTAPINSPATAQNVPIVTWLVSGDGQFYRGALPGLNLTATTIQVAWLDGNNDPEATFNRVQVTVSTTYKPMMTFIFGSPTYTLSAASTMTIAH
jgi:Flp pilus assembly protein TadG